MSMKKTDLFFCFRQQTVRQGKRDHDLDTPPTRSDKTGKRLWKARHPPTHSGRLRLADQVSDAEQHQSRIRNNTDLFPVSFQRGTKQNYRYLFRRQTFRLGSQIRNILPQRGNRLPAVFRLHGIQDNA